MPSGRGASLTVRALPVRRPHPRRARAARAARHRPRRSGLRARQPARDGEGRAVRALLALPGHAAAAVPRRVRRLAARGRRAGTAPRASAPRKLYERIFVGYGDDSVAQLGGAHVACEWVSNVLTKVLQRPRLAAYLEQSTRYIAYDAPMPGGGYRYYRDPELGPEYEAAMDALFDTYAAALPRVRAWVDATFPRADGEPEAARARAVNAKALDLLRGLLPAASLSHMGIYATGQAYEQLILHLIGHPLPEARRYGELHPRRDQGRDAELRRRASSGPTAAARGPATSPSAARPASAGPRGSGLEDAGPRRRAPVGRAHPRRRRRGAAARRAAVRGRGRRARSASARPSRRSRTRRARRAARRPGRRAREPPPPARAAASRRCATASRSSRTTARSATSSATGCSPCSGRR